MKQTKQFMKEFLKESGATEEAVNQFEELYDNDIQEAMKQEAQGSLYQSREEVSSGLQNISAAAEKHNVRYGRESSGSSSSIADMANKHSVRNK